MGSWAEVLAATCRVEIFDCGMASSGMPLQPVEPLLVDGGEATELVGALAIGELCGASCACLGQITFHLSDADGNVLARAALHHGTSMRWSGWDGDAVLLDGPRLVAWLNARGLCGPAEEVAASQSRQAVDERNRSAWVAACPESAAPLVDELLEISRTGAGPSAGLIARLEQALCTEFPDQQQRCAALLRWHSSGSGRRSGYPTHEGVPGDLLCAIPIEVIIEVAANSDDTAVLLGAARHLSGWRARTPKELAQVPSTLAARLIALSSTQGTDAAEALQQLFHR